MFSFILITDIFEEVEAEDGQEEEYTSEDVTTVEFSVIAPIVQNQQQVCIQGYHNLRMNERIGNILDINIWWNLDFSANTHVILNNWKKLLFDFKVILFKNIYVL